MSKVYFTLFILLITLSVHAREFKYFMRSPKALLMGDTGISNATGPQAMYYNPALLADAGLLEFYPLPMDARVFNYLKYKEKFEDFDTVESNPGAIVDRLIGVPIHVHFGGFPTIIMGGLALTGYYSNTFDLVIRNKIHPVLDIDWRVDRGWAVGYGHRFGDKNASIAAGVNLKRINRLGLKDEFGVFSAQILEIINTGVSDYKQLRSALGYSEGEGWGVDFGIQGQAQFPTGRLAFGFSINDIGGTDFSIVDGNTRVPDQEMAINLGASVSQDLKFLDWEVAFDLSPLNEDLPVMRKVHVGARVGIPFIDFMAGYNGGYASYGVAVDLFPIEIVLGRYGVETGYDVGDLESDRYVLYLSLLDFKFDL